MDDRVLEAAVRAGLLTAEQAEECREVQRAMRGMGIVPKALGEIAEVVIEQGQANSLAGQIVEGASG